jgi:uncharacterized protein (DUF1810 family)
MDQPSATTSICPKTACSISTSRNNSISSSIDSDPHDIEKRFFRPHQNQFSTALEELQNGRKESCWSWYFLPTSPYIVDGIERGSFMNRKYALRDDDQARAFLAFSRDGVHLRRNYLSIVHAIRTQLESGLSLRDLLGPLDDTKAISSFQLFERIGMDRKDTELCMSCGHVLELCGKKERQSSAPPPMMRPLKKRSRTLRTLLRCFPLKKKKNTTKKAKPSNKVKPKSPFHF